ILDEIVTLPYIQKMEFLISNGSDPLSNLQVQLDRQTLPDGVLPSSLKDHLQTQHIYSFIK
ncbi:MAG: bifunctional 3,4-dihydroxy-2-butanone-4-phosphate synthase/GTP cyclohydrolase II, partial [Dolichospermum sp.]